MVAKAKVKAKSNIKSSSVRRAPAPVKPADKWPFPTPGIGELGPAYKKHVVKATLSNVELAKARSALSLDLYADGMKIGNLEVGQGSFFWTGARRKKSKPIGWSTFAAMMNHLAYK
jgi:hypothetical protein